MGRVNLVEEFLDELQRRQGFDAWWDAIDEDIKVEVRLALLDRIPLCYGCRVDNDGDGDCPTCSRSR